MVIPDIDNQTQWDTYISGLSTDDDDFKIIPDTHHIIIKSDITISTSIKNNGVIEFFSYDRTITNEGNITNNNELYFEGNINNVGTITNNLNLLYVGGTITNRQGATITNNKGGTITKILNINNVDTIEDVAITNEGTIENGGLVEIKRGSITGSGNIQNFTCTTGLMKVNGEKFVPVSATTTSISATISQNSTALDKLLEQMSGKPVEEAPKEEAPKEEAPKEEAPKEEAPKKAQATETAKVEPKKVVEDKTQEEIKEIKIVINSNFNKIDEIYRQYNKIHDIFAGVRKYFDQQLGTTFDNLGKPEIYNKKIQEAKNERQRIFNTNVQNSFNILNEKVKNIKKELINGWDKIYLFAKDPESQFSGKPSIAKTKLIDVFPATIRAAGKFNETMSNWE